MKPKTIVAIVAGVAVLLWLRASREEAPLTDGAFLEYESGGMITRVTFSSTGGDAFRASVGYVDEDGEAFAAPGAEGAGETVDTRLRTEDGRIYEVGAMGPLWVPPGEVRVGGSAHGTRIDEVRDLEGRTVGVVRVSLGAGGALQGEWLYDAATGFLVGGSKSTAVSLSGEGQTFSLVDSNIPELGPR